MSAKDGKPLAKVEPKKPRTLPAGRFVMMVNGEGTGIPNGEIGIVVPRSSYPKQWAQLLDKVGEGADVFIPVQWTRNHPGGFYSMARLVEKEMARS